MDYTNEYLNSMVQQFKEDVLWDRATMNQINEMVQENNLVDSQLVVLEDLTNSTGISPTFGNKTNAVAPQAPQQQQKSAPTINTTELNNTFNQFAKALDNLSRQVGTNPNVANSIKNIHAWVKYLASLLPKAVPNTVQQPTTF